VLFEQPHEAELIWPGKTNEVTNVVLPFQSIESKFPRHNRGNVLA
jgi:adenine-specific DNA-methyltransferase